MFLMLNKMAKAGKKKQPRVFISIKKSEIPMLLIMLLVKLNEEEEN